MLKVVSCLISKLPAVWAVQMHVCKASHGAFDPVRHPCVRVAPAVPMVRPIGRLPSEPNSTSATRVLSPLRVPDLRDERNQAGGVDMKVAKESWEDCWVLCSNNVDYCRRHMWYNNVV